MYVCMFVCMYVLQMSPIAGIILLLRILRLTKLALVYPLEIVLMQKFFSALI